ncbi:dorsalin-1-like [Diachasmimorpha longicaudata]|uniref:dorsalin-1-like n=1 Tax=Diachasmimorpha longicaudata TaxID=58733 RepID=UPI0030B8C6A7
MFHHRQPWLLIPTGVLGFFCLWRTSPWNAPSVLTSTSIQLDLSLPAPSITNQRVFNITKKYPKPSKRRHRGTVSRYMLQLYHQRPSADIVRALSPLHVSGPIEHNGGGRILEFQLPPVNPEESLEAAELLGTAGMILRVKSMDHFVQPEEVRASRKDDSWRAFDVTSAVREREDVVKFLVRGRVRRQPSGESPILLLSYTKPKKRTSRSAEDEGEDVVAASWSMEARRRRKNPCRRRPLYVDFSAINYDEWIVAPPGYDAYQCLGKCFFPFPDHLNPTKHAIVQSLLHGALQGAEGGKTIGRVCCVPTRLAPTSLLYLDASGTLTYQYSYEDMVVVECGCR